MKKKYRNNRDHCCYTGKYRGAVHSIFNLKNSVPKKNSIVFHGGSNYLRQNTEKYTTFTVPIEKEVTKIDIKVEGITKNKSYILQFIDSARFMAR